MIIQKEDIKVGMRIVYRHETDNRVISGLVDYISDDGYIDFQTNTVFINGKLYPNSHMGWDINYMLDIQSQYYDFDLGI